MKKILYIQIYNNSLPGGCCDDVEVLDCRCINDFCSLVGNALVSDLKDENGKPYYRLINPMGRLLMDFKKVDEKIFNVIAEDWYDVLGNLLHKGLQEKCLTIKFPKQYVDWLTQNESPYYELVGLELQKNSGVLNLSSENLVDDIVATLSYKVSKTLNGRKDDIAFVVFNNPIIRNSSFIVKRVKFDGIEFLQYDSWLETKQLEIQKKKEESLKTTVEDGHSCSETSSSFKKNEEDNHSCSETYSSFEPEWNPYTDNFGMY